jgi:hypothetical protein
MKMLEDQKRVIVEGVRVIVQAERVIVQTVEVLVEALKLINVPVSFFEKAMSIRVQRF